MEPLLEVKNLTVNFKGRGGRMFSAVSGVGFTLGRGEALGIVGESGSGKSTIAKAVLRLIEPSNGSIALEGRDITKLKGAELRKVYKKIQMVFQSPAASFDPRRTLGDGVGESLRCEGLTRAAAALRVASLLERCGLPPSFAGRYPHEVSGGQCQRAAIARALAPSPEILICDEATSALDVTVQRQIMELMCSLRDRNGLSFLFISHSIALVQSFCSRVIVMQEGAIAEEGPTDKVIAAPQSEAARCLVEAAL